MSLVRYTKWSGENSLELCCKYFKTGSLVSSFFCKIFWKTQVLFCGATDIPVLNFWWCLPWVSKSGWIPHLYAFLPACNGFLRFTSGATPANLLMASMAAGHVPYMHVAEVGYRNSNGRRGARGLNEEFLNCLLTYMVFNSLLFSFKFNLCKIKYIFWHEEKNHMFAFFTMRAHLVVCVSPCTTTGKR